MRELGSAHVEFPVQVGNAHFLWIVESKDPLWVERVAWLIETIINLEIVNYYLDVWLD